MSGFVAEPGPDRASGYLKASVDAYVSGMEAAAVKLAPGVDAVGDGVKRLPDSGVQLKADGVLLFLGSELTFTDRDGQEFSLKFVANGIEGAFGGFGHGPELSEGAA